MFSPLSRLAAPLFFLLMAVPALLQPAMAQEEEGPDAGAARAFIETLADDTIALLQADLTKEEKTAEFGRLLEEGVNTDYVSRFVLGRNWRTASEAQRSEFQQLFKDFLLASLTERLAGEYNSETFTVKNAVAAGKRDVLVRSEIRRSSGPALPVEWRVRQFGDNWQIIDITAEGLSLAITQREEYGSVVQRQGMEALLKGLREQVASMRQGDADAPLDAASGDAQASAN